MSGSRLRLAAFTAFTAVFAVGAAIVFWGTWSLDVVPIMPDARTDWPASGYVGEWFRGWLANGKFVPGDVINFLGSPYFWQELKYVLAVYCSALGLAYFCRGRGLSRVASYGAGLLLGFSGYWITLFSAGHLGWFQWMTYGVFAFALVDRALEKGRARHWLMLGATVAWGSFYQSDLWLLFTTFTGVYFIFRWCCSCRRTPFVRSAVPLKGMLLAFAALALIGLPSFVSALTGDLAGRDKQIAESVGTTLGGDSSDAKEARWVFATNWSLPPSEVVEFFCPRVNGDTSCPLTLAINAAKGTKPYTGALGRPLNADRGNYRQHSLYVGWVACLLALFGCVSGLRSPVRRRTVLFFSVAAVVFCVFSFGRYCEPVYRCVFALPFGDYLRAPVKWHHLTEFCLCVLAGFGLEALLARLVRLGQAGRLGAWGRRSLAAPLLVALVVVLGVFDLVRVDRLYCAPVNVAQARKLDATRQMTYLRKQDFQNPQIAALHKEGRIVSHAYHPMSRDVYLVDVLTPRVKSIPVMPPFGRAAAMGLFSVLATLAVAGFTVFSVAKRR